MIETQTKGYTPCPCRDCFEIAIDCNLCHACEEAGCSAEGNEECAAQPEDDEDWMARREWWAVHNL
jgi:hypothetical protein